MKKLLILKKVLLGLSVIGVALPFCANTANVNCGNGLKVSSSSCENLLTNENMEKLGHKVFEGISQEIDDLDEENVQQIQMNVSYLLDNDLSIYFATENKVDKNNLSENISSKIFQLYNFEKQEAEEQNCGWFLTTRFWISARLETAIFCSWVVVITLFGLTFAADVYGWFSGTGCDFDNISTWNLYEGIHKKTIEGAFEFKKESNCDWSYHW